MRYTIKHLWLMALVVVASALISNSARAAALVVNTAADDTTAGDAFCTLREAILNANLDTDSTSGDCVAGSGADTITFGGDYTITLGSSLPDLSGTLTITGNGAAHTIVQAALSAGIAGYRIVRISSGTVILASMTLRYGVEASGGAVNVAGGSLTLNYVVLRDNQTRDTTGVGLNGGALSTNGGTVALNFCTVTANRATTSDGTRGNGGALFGGTGSLTVNNSTISNNAAYGNGGGIAMNNGGTLNVNFSTVTDNTSDADDSGAGSGGGIARIAGTVNLQGSIVAGNRRGTASSSADDCTGAISSLGYALTGSGTGCPSNGAGDVTVAPSAVFTTVIDVLASNGTDTPTHALLAGSPALNAVPSASNGCGTTFTRDERGTARPTSGACDIGAYEAPDTSAPVVTAFTASALAQDLSVAVTSFTASDDTGVVGYLITETPAAPTAADPGWQASAPTSYTFLSNGTYALYPWAVDAAGNVSALFASPVHVCPLPAACHTAGAWDEVSSTCSNPAEPDDTPCDDGDACTSADRCVAGACAPVGPTDCDDGDGCTIDTCDAATGCAHAVAADDSTCSDGDACTQDDTCQAGTCTSGPPVTCTPGECQSGGTCDSVSGQCSYGNQADGTPCTDGTCLAGACDTGVGGSGGLGGSGGVGGAVGTGGIGGAGASGGAGGTGPTGGAAGSTNAGGAGAPEDGGGCGCRTAGEGSGSRTAPWVLVLGLALAVARRRRVTS